MSVVTQIIGTLAFAWLFLVAICLGALACKKFWYWFGRWRHYRGCYRSIVTSNRRMARRAGVR